MSVDIEVVKFHPDRKVQWLFHDLSRLIENLSLTECGGERKKTT